MDIKPNFLVGSAVPKQEMLQIAFCNDAKLRASFGQWLYDNFSDLVNEYKIHGRFLTLAETEKILED